MKHIMHLHVVGQIQLVSNSTNTLDHLEGTNPSWQKLLGTRVLRPNIFGAKQDFLTNLIIDLTPLLVGVLCFPDLCTTQGSLGQVHSRL